MSRPPHLVPSVPTRLLADPNNIYAWDSQPLPTDKLDFRHHNYKEMRKVPALQPQHGAGGGPRREAGGLRTPGVPPDPDPERCALPS